MCFEHMARIHGSDHSLSRRTAVSNVETTVEQGTESVELVDCGAASEETKGALFGLFSEGSPAPFAWILIF
jgi:hypothetical protein